MTVLELIKKEKYWSPIDIYGGDTPEEFFSDEFPGTREGRELAIQKYGCLKVSYFYYAANYGSKLWKYVRRLPWFVRSLVERVAFRVNPQVLRIEVVWSSAETVDDDVQCAGCPAMQKPARV